VKIFGKTFAIYLFYSQRPALTHEKSKKRNEGPKSKVAGMKGKSVQVSAPVASRLSVWVTLTPPDLRPAKKSSPKGRPWKATNKKEKKIDAKNQKKIIKKQLQMNRVKVI